MELLQSMRLFARLAELGSFTKAAESLDIGRPQVTRSIQELETSLGVRLFQRTTRKVALTAEGERFYERVQEILAGISAATSMFDRSGATLTGRLRVDIPTAFAQMEFIKSLKEFTVAYPGINMILGVTDRAVDLVGEGIDCALRIGDLPDSTLIARPIAMATMVTCAAPAYLREHGEPKTLDGLASHRGVNFLSGQSNRTLPWQFSVKGQDRAYVSNAGITVTESNAYVQCGVSGFGIIQAPGIAVAEHLDSRGLVEILKSYRPAPRPVSLLYPSRTHLAPQVQVFIEWLQERFPQLHTGWLVP
ncbi:MULTISPECIES: LysR family transcriptional regulator [unclassified Pseudomonas]|uniref:LysR family transcriptional regulator n=1 Tax=unclassified Pseudomonas TaxID=196821 RepID=UPI001F212A62|nr:MULTISPECIES: LysR family transcriptional regulator [unclassified Pseudomonas]MCF5233212.1 LysR family transcriptional regulator [Pseudomonas sp. PA-5-4H]MCF5237443.1 LysR family transcriptional regulator [Pseudomonas sp. PA-5-4G]MCF5251430.1 LysR family transcriptional regulator [Pseudomonas sp. PA-5-4B]MCF5257103.1 LysR family transcriptional regulator [Pseudomonas sp. PA-5-4B]MCF5263362.1 LysR family transcriptional regulator [Pseudomonas sp. PA-5-4A]